MTTLPQSLQNRARARICIQSVTVTEVFEKAPILRIGKVVFIEGELKPRGFIFEYKPKVIPCRLMIDGTLFIYGWSEEELYNMALKNGGLE